MRMGMRKKKRSMCVFGTGRANGRLGRGCKRVVGMRMRMRMRMKFFFPGELGCVLFGIYKHIHIHIIYTHRMALPR